MRILLINPNTSQSFTDRVGEIAGKYALPSTEVVSLNPASGPRSLESVYDELLSSAGTLELAIAELDNFDTHLGKFALKSVDGKCIFLEGNNCKVYEHRPEICRKYPFFEDGVRECKGIKKI